MRGKSWPCERAFRGFSLVEVAAASALLATLLAGMMLAKARFDRQTHAPSSGWRRWGLRKALLGQWWPMGDLWPVNQQGAVANQRLWRWRTQERGSEPQLAALGVRQARLEIINEKGEVLSAVEVLLPPPPAAAPEEEGKSKLAAGGEL